MSYFDQLKKTKPMGVDNLMDAVDGLLGIAQARGLIQPLMPTTITGPTVSNTVTPIVEGAQNVAEKTAGGISSAYRKAKGRLKF